MCVTAQQTTVTAGRQPILRLDGLSVRFAGRREPTTVLDGLSLDVAPGSITALTGASGSGKSLTCLAILGLLPPRALATGRIVLDGHAYDADNIGGLAGLRGATVSLILQDPAASLNPVRRIGGQIAETVRFWHPELAKPAIRDRAAALLDAVGLGATDGFLERYPHQLSGGQNQRVMAALALASGARLVLADEPTSALDPKTAHGLLSLFDRLRREQGMSFLLISHDMDSVVQYADRIYRVTEGRASEVSVEAAKEPWIEALP